MPDWSYHTLFRPLLFQLPARAARDFTLGAMGLLSRLPGGTLVIKTLGHMESHSLLESESAGLRLRYPVGLSGGLDPRGMAGKALAQFGFGFMEIGPVTVEEREDRRPIRRDVPREAIVYPDANANEGLEKTIRRLSRKQGHRLPLMLRICPTPGASPEQAADEMEQLMRGLAPYAAAWYADFLNEEWQLEETLLHLDRIRRIGREAGAAKPMLLYVPLNYPDDRLESLLGAEAIGSWDGIVIGDAVRTGEGDVIGKDGKEQTLRKLAVVRRILGGEKPVIAAGGVHEPRDALELMASGADYVQLHSGLVYAGPGLPKRINEAVIYEKVRDLPPPEFPSFWQHWGWMCLLGIGMIVGGILAWIVAATTVMLPYDTLYLGIGPADLGLANPFLLPFMSHDRITLAGTMISIGILYYQLGRHGLRKNEHWAKTALASSGIVGFSSFFLYLGYGYFDPLHAAAAALLLPLFALSMRGTADWPSYSPVNTVNDPVWLRAQRGQFMMVALGFALAIGGLVIAGVGVTNVFVPQDLEFLCASPEMLAQINERLIPLIAHDRAGFGGALFSNAIAVLAAALWGIGEGRRWLWWTLLIGGLPGFAAGFSVHFYIGYTDFIHLLPAYFAFALFVLGLIWLYPYMMRKPAAFTGSIGTKRKDVRPELPA